MKNENNKFNSFEDLGKFYGIERNHEEANDFRDKNSSFSVKCLRITNSMRNGKDVTVISGFGDDVEERFIIEIADTIKKRLGLGGTVKERTILIQGNVKDKVKEIINNYYNEK